MTCQIAQMKHYTHGRLKHEHYYDVAEENFRGAKELWVVLACRVNVFQVLFWM